MSCDSYLFNKVMNGEILCPVLRLYGWSEKTISLGVNQKLQEGSNVVKRITGGQAVEHGLSDDEITYSICLHYEGNRKELYFEIGNVFIDFLDKYNLTGTFGYSNNSYINDFDCFNAKTSADIVVNDIKVIGSAQRRKMLKEKKKKYILQHGAIKLDKIRDLSRKKLNFEDAAREIKNSFKEVLNVQFEDYFLTSRDYEKINIHNEKVLIA